MDATTKTFTSTQDLLRYLKIPGTYKGYRQMVTAIDLAIEDEDRLLNVTIDLYPRVAEIHHTTSSCVQKNCGKSSPPAGKTAAKNSWSPFWA